uniref:B30.2/SPRY domain-containing protein n=1 Tax=Seriola lalandi dorsalis TaxID=1841481 RepID=A0A3B4YG99_SERLL
MLLTGLTGKSRARHQTASLSSQQLLQRWKTKAVIKLMIQERQMKIQEIKRSAELSRKSANRHTADSVQVFGALVQLVQRSLENLIEAIEEKQKTTQKQAEGYIQELEQEISELTKRSTEVERLSHIEDCSRDAIPPTKNWTEVNIPPPPYGRSLGSVVTQLKEKFINGTEKLIAKAKLIRVQEYAVDVSLDPDTANAHLLLSDNGKQVFCGDVEQNLPDNPERFKPNVNVLGKQSCSSGRFYYEVQVKGKTSWDLGIAKESVSRKGSITAGPETGYWTIWKTAWTVGVAKESIKRRGMITLSPENGFWTMDLSDGDEYKAIDDLVAHLSLKSNPERVGVFVDYDEGLVSFYDVEAADHLYTFTDCSFTEKLYPFFKLFCIIPVEM